MKVLFITTWYPTHRNPLKGIFIKRYAEAIKASGIDIIVLALDISHSENNLLQKTHSYQIENGVPTHIIAVKSKFNKFLLVNPIYQKKLLLKYYHEHIENHFLPNIIHSNVLYPAGLLGYWFSEKLNIPHVITEHWSKVDKFMSLNLFSNLGKRAYNKAEKITVVSTFLKKNISKYINKPEKILIIPNVIDTEIFKYVPKEKKNGITYAAIATWNPPKKPQLFFEALEIFSKQIENKVTLNIIGEGSLLETLKKKKWAFHINYMGNLGRQEIASVLNITDFFIHASDIETFSMVTAEALATGTPVIASNVGAIPELLNNNNGILCENIVTDWVRALNEAKNKLWNHSSISKQSDRFSSTTVGSSLREIYTDCINLRK